jgi:DNA polymerase III epsilon subunit-like protein
MLDPSHLWHDVPWCVLDTETTHYKPDLAEVVEVAAVRFERGRVVARYCARVKPPCPIPEAAAAIHGIRDADVAACLELAMHAPEIVRLAAGAVPVAFNASYDRTILHRTFAGSDCPAFDPSQSWICPLVIVRDVERVTPGRGYYRLENVCRRFQVPLDGAHSAEGDATATGHLLWRLWESQRVRSCALGKLLAHIDRRKIAHDAAFSW